MTSNRTRRRVRNRATTIAIGASALTLCLAACGGGDNGDDSDNGAGSVDPSAETVDQALYDGLPDSIRDSGVVKAGGAFESLPLLNADPSDGSQPIGVAPELTALMEPIIGVDIEWVNTAFPGQLPGLASGSLDILMGQISVTAEREQEIADFVPWFLAVTGIAYGEGNPTGVTEDLTSLCGMKVGTVSGSLYVALLEGASEKYCAANGEDAITVAEYPNAGAGSTALLSDQVDGYLEGAQSVRGIAAASDSRLESTQLNYEQTKEWDPGLYGIAVDKGEPGLTEAFLGAMQQIVEDGSYAEILEKYDVQGSVLTLDQIEGNPLTGTPFGEMAN